MYTPPWNEHDMFAPWKSDAWKMILSFLVWPIFRARWWLKKKTFSLLPGGKMNPFWYCAYFVRWVGWNHQPVGAGTLQPSPPRPEATRTTWLGSMWPLELLMPIVGRVWCARVENPRRRSGFSTRDRGWVFWKGSMGFFFPIQGQGLGKKLVDGGLKYGFRMFYVDGYYILNSFFRGYE